MLAEHLCSQTDCLIGSKCAVGVHIQCQLIIIGNLTHTGILNRHIHSLHRCIDGINRNDTDRQIFALVLVSADIASALCDGELHVQTAVFSATESCNGKIRIHNLNVLIHLDIRCFHHTLALKLNISCLRLIGCAVVLDRQTLDVHDNLSYILLNGRNRTELMQNTVDLYLAYCCSRQRREHNSSQGIT